MKKLRFFSILLVLISVCALVFSACSTATFEEMRANSHKDTQIIKDDIQVLFAYGGYRDGKLISGEQLLTSDIMTPEARKKFAADNRKFPRGERYYDVYVGKSDNGGDRETIRGFSVIVLVPLAAPDQRLVYERSENYKNCPYPYTACSTYLIAFLYLCNNPTQNYTTWDALYATNPDEDGVERGGFTLSFEPATADDFGLKWITVYHCVIDGKTYDVSYKTVRDLRMEGKYL